MTRFPPCLVLPLVRILLPCCLGGVSLSAWAEKADRDKPMNAEADALRYDDAKQTSVFTGNVVITKGSMLIRADRVEVRQDSEGYQFGHASSAVSGKRALFRQKRDGGDEWIEGEGESIAYDGKADQVTFNRNATLRRLNGTRIADEVHGAVIVYDNVSETFNVTSGAAAGSISSGNPSGRVRAVLSPRAAAPTAAPSASASSPAAPPASAAPPVLPLRASPALGEKK